MMSGKFEPSSSSSRLGSLRGTERDAAQAKAVVLAFVEHPIEKRLFASQLDRAMDELVRGYNSIPLNDVLSRQGTFSFANPTAQDDWVYFTSSLLDLRTRLCSIAAMSSFSGSSFSDMAPPPQYTAAEEKLSSSTLALDPLEKKIASLLGTRRAYENAKAYFLLLQHSQASPGFAFVSSDFILARGNSSSGSALKDVPAKINDLCTWYKLRLPLTEATYRLVSPQPDYSMAVLEGIKVEKPIDTKSQSAWMIQMGFLNATFELIRDVLSSRGGDVNSAAMSDKTERALEYISSLEVNWVGQFMNELPNTDRARNRRIHFANELTSLRLALLQARLNGSDQPRMELLHI